MNMILENVVIFKKK